MSVTPDSLSDPGAGAPLVRPPDAEAELHPEESAFKAKALEYTEKYALPALFVLTFIFFSTWSKTGDNFLSSQNIKNVLGYQAVYGILALAIMIPLVCGEFDFSVGSAAGLCQVLCAGFMVKNGWPVWAAIAAAIAIGALIGLSNGNTVARVGVNSLIVTLGVASVLAGIVQWYTNGLSISNGIPQSFIDLGSGEWFGLPKTIYYLIGVALVLYYVLEHTPFGRYLQSVGSNREAARLVGLPVERLVLLSFVCSGALAGVAGVLLASHNGSASPQLGTVVTTLGALAAAYLGATSIKPGRFNVLGTLIAVFFLAFTVTGLSLAGVANWINDVFNGAALFVAVLISTIIGRKRAGVA
jgi:ribose transport system permease protein